MIGAESRDPWAIVVAAVITASVAAFLAFSSPSASAQGTEQQEPRGEAASPKQLFQRDCAICHGTSGQGTARGPDLTNVGTAAIDFMVRTGRMPPPNPALDRYELTVDLPHAEPQYDESEIEALVDYTGTFIGGPEVPDVHVDEALEAEGGQLFRLNCASCHQFAGVGGVLIDSGEAPTLHLSSPIEVAEAIRIGPGTMPAFPERVLNEEEVNAIASYVEELRHPRDEGGIALIHYGPFSEGAIAWLIGIGALLVTAKWIGRRT